MSWSHLYTEDCPPNNAQNQTINPVFRFVESNDIDAKDFEPLILKFPNKEKYQNCLGKGTSIFSSYKTMLEYQKIFPYFRKCKIANGRIDEDDGKTIIGKDNHITWWVETNTPQSKFTVQL